MCQNVRSAIDVIKVQKRKTLTKEETLMLFTKVIEDSEKMGERLTNLEKTSQETKQEVSDIKADVKIIKKLLEDNKREKKKTTWDRLREMPKYFWITIWIVLAGLFGWLGVQLNIAGLGEIVKGR